MLKEGRLSHRSRKNPRAAELWQERKKAANAARGKQVFTHADKAYSRFV